MSVKKEIKKLASTAHKVRSYEKQVEKDRNNEAKAILADIIKKRS